MIIPLLEGASGSSGLALAQLSVGEEPALEAALVQAVKRPR